MKLTQSNRIYCGIAQPLTPYSISDYKNGRSAKGQYSKDSRALSKWILKESNRLLKQHKSKIAGFSGDFAYKWARDNGITSNYNDLQTLGAAVPNRVGRIAVHKVVSEYSAFANSKIITKKWTGLSPKIDLSQGNQDLIWTEHKPSTHEVWVRFKPMTGDYLLKFKLPRQYWHRPIEGFSTPSLASGKWQFTFWQAAPERQLGNKRAGVDIGITLPYTAAVINKREGIIAQYTTSKKLLLLSKKLERLGIELTATWKKCEKYERLDLDSTILELQKDRLSAKKSRLKKKLAELASEELALKLAKHGDLGVVFVEDLRFRGKREYQQQATAFKKWNSGESIQKIEHAVNKLGLPSQKRNAAYSSQACSRCAGPVVFKSRIAVCTGCKLKRDRDLAASVNMATFKHKSFRPPSSTTQKSCGSRTVGVNCSSKEQVSCGTQSKGTVVTRLE
jgi:transposase